jgi:hypothetical protein
MGQIVKASGGTAVAVRLRQAVDRAIVQLRHDIRRLTQAELVKRYPAEWSSFRAMKRRAVTDEAVIAPDMATFKKFLAALGVCPVKGWTVDRIDTFDPEYAVGKVRWASKKEQANNRRSTIFLRDRHGVVRPLQEIARATGQKPDTIRKRLARGFSQEEALVGRRSNRHPVLVAVASSEWPSICIAPRWEDGYRKWQRLPTHLRFSRRGFFVWIAANRQRELLGILERRYPDEIGDNSDPNYVPAPPVTEDVLYREWREFGRLKQAIEPTLTEAEGATIRKLRRHNVRFRKVTRPDAAAKFAAELAKPRRELDD